MATSTTFLARTAEVKNTIEGIDGIEEAKVKMPIQEAALETEVDLAKAQKHGLKPGDVRRAAACLLSGIQVGALYEDQKVFDVVVWSTPETRHDINSISNLDDRCTGGQRVRLGDVADVRIKPAASVIRHDGVKRYVDVVADVNGRDLAAVAADIKQQLKDIKYPAEYYARVLGDYAAPQTARNHLILLTLLAAVGIFFLLQSAFGSWRLAAISFVTIPAALIGGLLAAIATGGTVISLGSLAGLLAVFGHRGVQQHYADQALPTAVCHSGRQRRRSRSCPVPIAVRVAKRIDGIAHTNGAGFGPGLVQHGAVERLGPILTTALATAAALVPVLFLGDVPGSKSSGRW